MFSDVESFDERSKLKKTNKPLMEKKRRARINHCLLELKDILIKDKHASVGHAKWEKADILEMTVEYVKVLRKSQGLPPLPTASTSSPPATLCSSASANGEDSDTPTERPSPRRRSSPIPSPCSTERTVSPAAKRRRITPVMAPTPIPPSFMTQQLLAMQHFQMKMAATAPMISSLRMPGAMTLPTPFPWPSM